MTMPEVLVRSKSQEKTKETPKYLVILVDDDFHSHEYVINMCERLFGHPREAAVLIAHEVHTLGDAVVWGASPLEIAELKRDQIHAFGKDPLVKGCAGSMTARLERV